MLKKVRRVFALCRNHSYLEIISRNLLGLSYRIHSDKDHLGATIEWLCRAQDVTGCGGISCGYHYYEGWLPPYPETTGYIVPTFLQYASLNGESSYIERAVMMGDWEIEIQLPAGAVRGGTGINKYPIAFNTGQVILGWASLYRETGESKFLNAAVRAADWLLSVQDDDGKWSKYTFGRIPHVYHTRIAWPLLEIYELTHDERYKDAAEKQILWALSCVKENGWFNQMGFAPNQTPFTHTIAYTLRGLLESSFHLEEIKPRLLNAVQKASENIMMRYELGKRESHSMPMYLPATLNEEWQSRDHYSCLTGNAQIAVIWLKLYKIDGDTRFLNNALNMIDQVKATQLLHCKDPGVRGGVPGSYPIWGKYIPFTYVNWAAKFFVDALLLRGETNHAVD